MDMMGAFHCPHCGTKNACECKTCTPYIKKGEYINTWTADGEAHICGKCCKIYSPDQSLDEEMRQRNFLLQGGMDVGNQVDTPEEETLAKIKFVLSANNDAQAIRLLEQYGEWQKERILDFLYSEITERRDYSASKMCEKVIEFIEQFKNK